jgi:hypothetical protein
VYQNSQTKILISSSSNLKKSQGLATEENSAYELSPLDHQIFDGVASPG